MIVISRDAAVAAGMGRYFTGKPCRSGHVCERHVAGHKCVQCHAARMAAFHAARRPARLAKMQVSSRENFKRNKARITEAHRRWRKENPQYNQARLAIRRARKQQALPLWFGEFDAFVWSEALHLNKLRFEATGIKWHADHAIPLGARLASGLHVAHNCQVIPAVMNTKKCNNLEFTDPFDWVKAL